MCCSISSSRVAVSSAPCRAPSFARAARLNCRSSRALSARDVGPRPPGRSPAAANARGVGSRSPPPGRRSSTTPRFAPSSPPGRHGLRGLGPLAAAIVAAVVQPPSAQLVAFVPPDGDRSLSRGHHPPERLARELARLWRLPIAPLLRRTRPLRPQRGLPRDARRRNLRGAFRADPVRGRVLLVDDVYTTGSTVGAASSALRASGASSVDVVTFARAVRR